MNLLKKIEFCYGATPMTNKALKCLVLANRERLAEEVKTLKLRLTRKKLKLRAIGPFDQAPVLDRIRSRSGRAIRAILLHRMGYVLN